MEINNSEISKLCSSEASDEINWILYRSKAIE